MQIDNQKRAIEDVMQLGLILEPVSIGKETTVGQFIKVHGEDGSSYILVMQSLIQGTPSIHFALLLGNTLKFCELDHLGVRLLTAQRIYKPKHIQ
jgi:hypothetical protein